LPYGSTTIWLYRYSFNRDFGCELLAVWVCGEDLWIFDAGPDTGSKAILLSNQNTFMNSFAMSHLASILVIIVIWTVTYLTNLGASEFRSEEGHRVMPSVQMLESGNYVVPYVGTEPYLRKPPLVNWIVAGSPITSARS